MSRGQQRMICSPQSAPLPRREMDCPLPASFPSRVQAGSPLEYWRVFWSLLLLATAAVATAAIALLLLLLPLLQLPFVTTTYLYTYIHLRTYIYLCVCVSVSVCLCGPRFWTSSSPLFVCVCVEMLSRGASEGSEWHSTNVHLLEFIWCSFRAEYWSTPASNNRRHFVSNWKKPHR